MSTPADVDAESAGSKWLGDLPAHWEIARLSHVAVSMTSNVDKHSVDDEPAVRLCNYTDVYKNEAIVAGIDFMAATASDDQIDRFRLKVGDTVITKDSETADDIGIPAFVEYEAPDLICGYHLAIVRPDTRSVNARYLFWSLMSAPTLRQWEVLATGITRVGIRSGDISKASLPLPPLDEQDGIAAYLDAQTARIDALVRKQGQLIERARERRTAATAVELDPLVSCDGGTPLRWLCVEVDVRAADCGVSGDDIPLLSVSIHHGVQPREAVDGVLTRAEDLSNYKVVEAGDIVVNRMRAFQGGLGFAAVRGLASPDYLVLRPGRQVDGVWLSRVMRTPAFVAEMASRVRGIGSIELGSARTPRINPRDLGMIGVGVPSIDDQRATVAHMDAKTAKIDALIAKTERFIELAKERRAALITAAVTGQIDVRTATLKVAG